MKWSKSIKLVKRNEVVSQNDQSPVSIVDNWGRSNEINIINETSQIQWRCIMEWTISCLECSKLRKIEWIESNQAN